MPKAGAGHFLFVQHTTVHYWIDSHMPYLASSRLGRLVRPSQIPTDIIIRCVYLQLMTMIAGLCLHITWRPAWHWSTDAYFPPYCAYLNIGLRSRFLEQKEARAITSMPGSSCTFLMQPGCGSVPNTITTFLLLFLFLLASHWWIPFHTFADFYPQVFMRLRMPICLSL